MLEQTWVIMTSLLFSDVVGSSEPEGEVVLVYVVG